MLQIIGLKIFGKKGHKVVIDWFNACVAFSNYFILSRVKYIDRDKYVLDKNRPHIIVSNHQNMADVAPIYSTFRENYPKYVTKKELSKGIPGLSYNIRNGGSISIDRNNPKESLMIMAKFGKYIAKNNFSAVLFPEGTRSKTGVPRRFSKSGFQILFKYIPNAIIVPVTINNAWKVNRYGAFPLDICNTITLTVHETIDPTGMNFNELFEKTEKIITDAVKV